MSVRSNFIIFILLCIILAFSYCSLCSYIDNRVVSLANSAIKCSSMSSDTLVLPLNKSSISKLIPSSTCVFVLKPEKIISKYMDDMDYTDFSIGETRLAQQEFKRDAGLEFHTKEEIAKYNKVRSNAQRIIDILTNDTN